MKLLIGLTALFMLIPVGKGFGQIAFANGWNTTTSAPNVTTAAAGSNRLLLYIICFEDDDNTNDVTSVTYGGQSMTQAVQISTITGGGSQNRVEMWYLNNTGITAATHNTFTPAFSISNPTVAHGYYTMAVTLTGVSQSTPVCSTGTGGRLTSSTVNLSAGISVLPSEVIIYATSGGDVRTHTPATGYTEVVDISGAGGGQAASVNTRSITTGATENPTSTASGNHNRFVIAAIRLLPNGASCSSALPVALVDFKAKRDGTERVVVSWETASEINNAFFTVEKSKDAVNWDIVATVKGAINSRLPIKYHTLDYSPCNGTCYYRLKQTDLDKTESSSWIVAINDGSLDPFYIEVSPNPGNHTIKISATADLKYLKVRNVLGVDYTSNILLVEREKHHGFFDVSGLPQGTYILEAGTAFVKFIKI